MTTVRNALRFSDIDMIDAEVLLAHALGRSRSWLIAHDNDELPGPSEAAYMKAVKRRAAGEPVAYITKEKEFYGRTFSVTPVVLIPRPSTETLVEETLRLINGEEGRVIEADSGISVLTARLSPKKPEVIVDIGTGSGIIAISLAKEGWAGSITAVDLSRDALEVAKENAQRHEVGERITFLQGDGSGVVAELKEPFLLVSNPPYIPDEEEVDPDVKDFEPPEALFAGISGMDVILPLVKAASENPACMGIALEIRSDQVKDVLALLR